MKLYRHVIVIGVGKRPPNPPPPATAVLAIPPPPGTNVVPDHSDGLEGA